MAVHQCCTLARNQLGWLLAVVFCADGQTKLRTGRHCCKAACHLENRHFTSCLCQGYLVWCSPVEVCTVYMFQNWEQSNTSLDKISVKEHGHWSLPEIPSLFPRMTDTMTLTKNLQDSRGLCFH